MAAKTKPSPRTVFADRLDEALRRRGMVRRELSEMTGIQLSTINAWFGESSGLPNLQAVIQVAAALNLSIDYLAGVWEHETPIGELPPDAQLLSLDLIDAVLAARPKEDNVEQYLAWDPLVFHGMTRIPDRFRIVGRAEADAVRDQVYAVLFNRFPRLYDKWHKLFGKALRHAKRRLADK